MKRDMDLVRRIALATANLEFGETLSELEGVDAYTFGEHVQLMAEADLIDAQIAGGFPEPIAIVMRLTWAGNDFVDAVKDDALWKRAMSKVVKSGASFTFEILKEALKTEITQGFPSLRGGA